MISWRRGGRALARCYLVLGCGWCLGLPGVAQTAQASGKPPVPVLEESGFRTIFDGKTLDGWDCDPDFWRASGGAIVGETNQGHQPKQNTFCIWKGGQPDDFELRAEYRLTGVNDGNSGFQYRSEELPQVAKWVLKGYQADIDLKQQYSGQIYEERGRGFLALRGQISYIPDGAKVGSIGSVGDNAQLRSFIKDGDWNSIDILARGNTLIQMINEHVMSVVVDDDAKNRKMQGEIGIQLHRLPKAAMKMETRSIRIKTW